MRAVGRGNGLRRVLEGAMLRNVLVLSAVLTPIAASHSCAGSAHFDPLSPPHLTDLIVDCRGHARDGNPPFVAATGRLQHVCTRDGFK